MQRRKQIRLKEYDYSQNGYYFVTICAKDRQQLFGEIVGADSLSARIVRKAFIETIEKYEYVNCPIYVIMPNHIHCIIAIEKDDTPKCENMADGVRADNKSAPTNINVSLADIIREFKRRSTVEYINCVKQNILPAFDKQIWQRGYYEHIIRNEQEYQKIYEYIENNPLKWDEDQYYM